MLFNSIEFLLAFLPITLIIYFVLNKIKKEEAAKLWLVVASLYFYGYFNKRYILIIVSSIIVNFIIGRMLYKEEQYTLKRKVLLIIGIVFNIGILGYFKYSNFFIENINIVFSKSLPLLKVALPLGISFFTFQQLSFIIDSYRGKSYNFDFLSYCLFVTFFPQLIAGPIVLPSEVIPQFQDENKKSLNYGNLNRGLYMFSIGLVKKVIIADTLSTLVSVGFDFGGSLTIMESWISSLAFTFQIYYDFSGYCDMAMGIGLMFNIDLPLNFDSPYKSSSIQEFWRRWHITLGRFLTNYLYIPLGGNRSGRFKTLRNLFVVFLVSGIWHGAGWTFILWGALHGLAIVIHKIWSSKGRRLNKTLGIFITFNLVNIFWVFFRATSINSALEVIKGMFRINTLSLGVRSAYKAALSGSFKLPMVILVLSVALTFLGKSTVNRVKTMKLNNLTTVEMITYLIVCISLILSNKVSTFLYFNF